MRKWLVSIALTLALFVGIFIVLGMLLLHGEQDNARLIEQQQIESAASVEQASASDLPQIGQDKQASVNSVNDTPAMSLKDVITVQLTNLSCRSHSQCTVISVPKALGCQLAINVTGKKQLPTKNPFVDASCGPSTEVAQCVNGRCTLQSVR